MRNQVFLWIRNERAGRTNEFFRYALVGCGNTLLHWLSFAALLHITRSQTASNLLAFFFAASASFLINARFTFRAHASRRRYILFVTGMATLSMLTGLAGDLLALHPLLTLVVFSACSLVLGFLFTKFFVFRSDAS